MNLIIAGSLLTRSAEDVIPEEVQCISAVKGVTVSLSSRKKMVLGDVCFCSG